MPHPLQPDPGSLADLRRFVRTHQVCWELVTHFEYRRGAKLPTGFDLELFARMPGESDAASEDCMEAYRRLREVALHAMPPGVHFTLSPFEAALYLRPESDYSPAVRLAVEIRSPAGAFRPLDGAEREELRALPDRLAALGAHERSWRRRSA